jgi:hypothetical protein
MNEVYAAFFVGHSQVHFGYKLSLFIAGATTTALGLWAATLPPPFDVAVASVIGGLAAVTLDDVAHHNCLGVEIPWIGFPKSVYYRSKSQCG